jgi:hypothetical protein
MQMSRLAQHVDLRRSGSANLKGIADEQATQFQAFRKVFASTRA